MTGRLDTLICGGVGMFLWLLELKVDHSREWTKQKMFEDVKRLRHLICQHQQWWLRIAHKMQEPRSPREIAAVNIRTLPSPGSRDQPARWACKCSTLMSPKTKDQMASPTSYPTSSSQDLPLPPMKTGCPKKKLPTECCWSLKISTKKNANARHLRAPRPKTRWPAQHSTPPPKIFFSSDV